MMAHGTTDEKQTGRQVQSAILEDLPASVLDFPATADPNARFQQTARGQDADNIHPYDDQTSSDAVNIDPETAADLRDFTREQAAAFIHRLPSQEQCGRGALVGVDTTWTKALIVPLSCKSWECPKCAPRKRAAWVRKLAAGKPTKVMTLTADPKISSDLYGRALLMKAAFETLMKRIRFQATLHPKLRWMPPRSRFLKRRAMKSRGEETKINVHPEVEYALIWELAGENHLHAHVLLRAPFIPQGWLSWNWKNLGIGSITHIKQSKGSAWEAEHAAKNLDARPQRSSVDPEAYVTKSTAETAHAIAPLKIIQLSSGYAIPDAGSNTTLDRTGWIWTALRRPAEEEFHEWIRNGTALSYKRSWDGTIELDISPTIYLMELFTDHKATARLTA
jgi:hypothetical protein